MGNDKKASQPEAQPAIVQAEQPRCPKCSSIIYSRRNPRCGACGECLPEELLFTPDQRKILEREIENSKKGTPLPSGSDGSVFISSTDFGSV